MINFSVNDYHLGYLAWNTFLGVIPIFLCAWLFRINRNKNISAYLPGIAIFLVWLFLVPNAPYMISELRHINGFCPDTVDDNCMENSWMIFFFFFYSLWGWLLYYLVIEQMNIFFKRYFSSKIIHLFPILISPVIAIGLLLGLFDRLNSWDLITRPIFIIKSSLYYITEPLGLMNLIAASLSLIILFYLGKIIFRPLENLSILQKFIDKS